MRGFLLLIQEFHTIEESNTFCFKSFHLSCVFYSPIDYLILSLQRSWVENSRSVLPCMPKLGLGKYEPSHWYFRPPFTIYNSIHKFNQQIKCHPTLWVAVKQFFVIHHKDMVPTCRFPCFGIKKLSRKYSFAILRWSSSVLAVLV